MTLLFSCPAEEIWLPSRVTVAACSVYSTLTMVMSQVFAPTCQKSCYLLRMQRGHFVFGSLQPAITIMYLCTSMHQASLAINCLRKLSSQNIIQPQPVSLSQIHRYDCMHSLSHESPILQSVLHIRNGHPSTAFSFITVEAYSKNFKRKVYR
jgi:hypothetical protein